MVLGLILEVRMVGFLAERLEGLRAQNPERTEAAFQTIVRAERTGRLPLSFAQQRLWFLDRFGSGSAYNIPQALRVTGALDTAALESALRTLVRRHESLRTVFREEDGEAFQHVLSAEDFSLARVDLQALPTERREAEGRRPARQDSPPALAPTR